MSQQAIGGSTHTLVTVQIPVTADLLHGTLGIVRIGELLKSMDIAACMSAERHSLSSSVTLSMDDVNFSDARATPGDVMVIRSRVNRAFKTSMEVGLKVEIETPDTGHTRHLCSSYFVFVALDGDGNKVDVPPLLPVTEKEKVRWALAGDRRQIRLDQAKIIEKVVKEKPTGLRYSVVNPHASNPRGSIVSFGEFDDRRNEVTQMVLPQHANHYGNTFGGQVMCWAHEVAETAAARHARTNIVTVSVDDMFFLAPSKVGTRVVIKASVNRVFNRSMEVGVRVEGHHLNGEIVLINRAYFTMVAIDLGVLAARLNLPTVEPLSLKVQLPKPTPEQQPAAIVKKSSVFFKSRAPSTIKAEELGAPSEKTSPQLLPRTESKLQPIRSVPLNTPDQIRRHQEALGRRRVRLERLQLKKSNHLAWPFTPDTNPRAFALENLKSLESVAIDDDLPDTAEEPEPQQGEGGDRVPRDQTINRGVWGLVAESEGVMTWSKSSLVQGISMKSQCEITAPFDALVYAVWDPDARAKWDKVVVGSEIRHRFDHLDSDIVWLAVDMRTMDPKAKPTDFALLRSWKRAGDTFCVASHSVVHHSVPGNTNYVRAETASSGFILRDLGGGKVDIQYVVQLNRNGTSIVAGELVGSSKWYAMRMRFLAEYASSLPFETYSQVNIARIISNNSSLGSTTVKSGDTIPGIKDKDMNKNCVVS